MGGNKGKQILADFVYLTKIDEINYLQFMSIIGIIGNQWKTQTQLWEQWSTISLPMDPVSVHMQ